MASVLISAALVRLWRTAIKGSRLPGRDAPHLDCGPEQGLATSSARVSDCLAAANWTGG